MRKPFLAGNWKMNTNSVTSVNLAAALAQDLAEINTVDVAVCPPFVYLQAVAAAATVSDIAVGAQDVYFEGNGVTYRRDQLRVLKDCGCVYVILGHSGTAAYPRRDRRLINKKIRAAIQSGMLLIFCVGELLEQRQRQDDGSRSRSNQEGLRGHFRRAGQGRHHRLRAGLGYWHRPKRHARLRPRRYMR